MTIKTSQDLKALERALDRCKSSVWLESVHGERYNLKDDLDRYRGIGKLLSEDGRDLEMFTVTREDEGIMLTLFNQLSA